jgi:hypothetical protein
MAIKSGRDGQVLFDPTGGATPVVVLSLNKWKLSQKTGKTNVTCFGDANLVYIPGLPDVSGSLSGFWNSVERTLFAAAPAVDPGMLELVPNTNEPTFKWSGLAYLSADIDTAVEGAPAVSSEFMAAGPWTMAPPIVP